ncbi:MAG: ABC transporter substrate-binding protein [Methanoregula sp.]|nr:ABC transporter substrate-binding protein [Methanoregula sp.]
MKIIRKTSRSRVKCTISTLLAVVSLIILCSAAGCSGQVGGMDKQTGTGSDTVPVTDVDSLGNTVILPHTARRIICQNGDAAEMLIALGAGDRIVGVVETTITDPLLMPHLPNARSVGNWQTPNIEKILALRPDVFLTYTTPTKNMDQLIAANLTLVPVDCYKITELNRDATVLGTLTGTDANVSRYTAFNDRYLTLVKERVAQRTSQKPLRVYVEGYTDYSAHATGSGGDHLLKLLNATNIAGSISTQSATVSPEWVIDQNPYVIIKIAMDPEKYEPLDEVRERILHRHGLSTIHAVRERKVYVLNGDIISSPRGIVGVLYTAKALYPEQFQDIDPELVLEEYAREFVSGTDQIQTFSPSI